jgi:hypothetical protein
MIAKGSFELDILDGINLFARPAQNVLPGARF